jgi:PhzF family phenazine biosynthesis protein
MAGGTLYRLSAFAHGSDGGNPAGVWVGTEMPESEDMQRIAAEVGYSETAFVTPAAGRDRQIRYFSPEAEVSFCGHATIATGIVLGKIGGEGTYRLSTPVGLVPVTVRQQADELLASLQSVEPRHESPPPTLLADVLSALSWDTADLDDGIPPARAFAGAWHLVLAVSSDNRLASLDYDFERLKAIMLADNLTTLQLVWREREDLFIARNPFPVGGVVEDPATGAAAAALGGYLRDAGLITTPHRFVIRQGHAIGAPSLLLVDVPKTGGIVVSGTAIDI